MATSTPTRTVNESNESPNARSELSVGLAGGVAEARFTALLPLLAPTPLTPLPGHLLST